MIQDAGQRWVAWADTCLPQRQRFLRRGVGRGPILAAVMNPRKLLEILDHDLAGIGHVVAVQLDALLEMASGGPVLAEPLVHAAQRQQEPRTHPGRIVECAVEFQGAAIEHFPRRQFGAERLVRYIRREQVDHELRCLLGDAPLLFRQIASTWREPEKMRYWS